MANFLEILLGDPNKKAVNQLKPVVVQINAFEAGVEALTDEQLRDKTTEFKARLAKGEMLDDLLPEAFAVVRESAKRVLGERHYDVQLMGGAALHKGKIAEMRTGEGKTLVATLPVYLNALSGKGVHVVTVNDYLAKRDAEWMGQVYQFLGLTVGVVIHGMSSAQKRDAYGADITYGTNNEFGFDYLRDNMASSAEEQVQRGLNFAIVDEVDSILIDEARTPLIISAADEESTNHYKQFAVVVPQLNPESDYILDEKLKSALLTEAGIERVQKILNIPDIYESGNIILAHHIEQALRAQTLYKRDVDYVVNNGEVVIVDEFTGRLMEGRRYSEGLHQAIEAKEGVEIKRESKTMATITFQNYFRLYEKLSGMTGTAKTEEEEFWKIYGLEVVVIPTNQAIARKDLNDLVYASEAGKFKAVVREIKARHESKQPILVGTIAIEKSEVLSNMLRVEGIAHEVLNAKQHDREAVIIQDAGKAGAVTIATNMAGRGTDIKLDEHAKKAGGLHVIGTERHESRRIDNQLRGRSGRQGDPGSTQFFVSMEDDLMRLFGSDKIKNMMKALKIPEDEPLEHGMISSSLEAAQKRVEGHNFDIRKRVVEYDDVMNRHRATIYKQRQASLTKGDVHEDVWHYIESEIGGTVAMFAPSVDSAQGLSGTSAWNIDGLVESINVMFPVGEKVATDLKSAHMREEVQEKLLVEAKRQYEAKEQEASTEEFRQAERAILLRVIDILWVEHLDAMMKLREAIGLHGYGQRDPLVEYKQEAYEMFQRLQSAIGYDVARLMYKVKIVNTSGVNDKVQEPNSKKQTGANAMLEASDMEAAIADGSLVLDGENQGFVPEGIGTTPGEHLDLKGGSEPTGDFEEEEKELEQVGRSAGQQVSEKGSNAMSLRAGQQTDAAIHPATEELVPMTKDNFKKSDEHNVGRNDPCWCGSGKKYKKCHGA